MIRIIQIGRSCLSHLWKFLSHDKTPLGITLLLTIGAGIGTYYLAPSINRTLQKDNARAAHILSSIDQINGDMIDLSESVRRFNFSVQQKKAGDLIKKRDASYDKIAAMQWRLIDISVIADSEDEKSHVDNFKNALTKLQFGIQASYSHRKTIDPKLLTDLSVAGYLVLDDLYRKAGIYTAKDAEIERAKSTGERQD